MWSSPGAVSLVLTAELGGQAGRVTQALMAVTVAPRASQGVVAAVQVARTVQVRMAAMVRLRQGVREAAAEREGEPLARTSPAGLVERVAIILLAQGAGLAGSLEA